MEAIKSIFELLKKSNKVAHESTTTPRFNVILKRDHLGNINHFIISFQNIKDSFSKFKDLPSNPLENLHKLSLQFLQLNNLPPNLTMNDIINLLKEKSLEKKLVNTVILNKKII